MNITRKGLFTLVSILAVCIFLSALAQHFDITLMLVANETYNFSIITGSYQQIIHNQTLENEYGTLTCTKFTDVTGKTYYDWIPAIRFEQNTLPDGLGYLADDLYNLPEILDGVSQKELEAAERIVDLMISLDP